MIRIEKEGEEREGEEREGGKEKMLVGRVYL
jgi:hypothetical protein